jgi:adenylate kinase
MPKNIIITGVPGTGKTTVSKMLSERIGGVHIDLSELVKREKLYSHIDEERQTLVVDLDKLGHKIELLVSETDKNVIIDGHLAQLIVPTELVSTAFILRRAPWELEKVLNARGWLPDKVKENVEAELIDVVLVETLENIEEEKICEINTTGMTSGETVTLILQVLEEEVPCKYGNVDWLGEEEARRYII